MSTKEERDEAIGNAMVEKIKAETAKLIAERELCDAQCERAVQDVELRKLLQERRAKDDA